MVTITADRMTITLEPLADMRFCVTHPNYFGRGPAILGTFTTYAEAIAYQQTLFNPTAFTVAMRHEHAAYETVA